MACSFSCLSTYACSAPVMPPDGAVWAPYVIVGFQGNGEFISVGNNSSPDKHAVIKSFEYGFSEGAGVKVEIFDEEGSSLSTFVQRLNKTVCAATNDYRMFVDFGWIKKSCNNTVSIDLASTYDNKFYFLPLKVEMSYEGSKIKYVIEGTDLQDRIAENRLEKGQGTEDNKKKLKQAIKDLFSENCPQITNVRFEKWDGTEWKFRNQDGGPDGPRAVWTSDQQNGLATTRRWLDRLTTYDEKGVVFQWKPNESEPTMIILEDPNPSPGENDPCCQRSIGTYIVNGGKCSSVISFTPQINWTLGSNAGSGGAAGGTDGGTVKAVGREGSQIERVGTQTSMPAPQNENMWRPPPLILKEGQKASAAHEAAVRFREVRMPIEAELKLIGDPKLAFPLGGFGLVGKTVSLVVINPFYIRGSNCMWTAQPSCNEVLSNKKWMIKGANHQIKDGSYVTILKLFLEVPNVDTEPGTVLGGGCGTMSFDNDKAQDF